MKTDTRCMQFCWYFETLPSTEQISIWFEKIGAWSEIPYQTITFVDDSFKDRKKRYHADQIAKWIDSASYEELFHLCAHSENSKGDNRDPRFMCELGKLVGAGNPFYLSVTIQAIERASEIDQTLCQWDEMISSDSGAAYGFGCVRSTPNLDFSYHNFHLLFVEKPSQDYLDISVNFGKLKNDTQITTGNFFTNKVRSIHRWNFVSYHVFEQINRALISKGIDRLNSSSLVEGRRFFKIETSLERKVVFEALCDSNMTRDSKWVDVENYQPSNQTYSV